MIRARTLLPALALMSLIAATAGAQDREQLQTQADIRMLTEQVAKLQLAVNQLAEQLAAANKRIEDFQQKTTADQQVTVAGLASDVNTIRQNLSVTSNQVQQLTQEVPALRTGVSQLTDQMRTLLNLIQPGAAAPGAPAAGPPSSAAAGAPRDQLGQVPQLPESPGAIFQAARFDYMSSRYENAIDGFTEFVQKFPDAPQAAEAQIDIGRSLKSLKRQKEAIAAFQKVIDTYKDSPQVPDAYFEQGMCYLELKQRTEARRIFRMLTTDARFKDSSARLLAAQQLQNMGTP